MKKIQRPMDASGAMRKQEGENHEACEDRLEDHPYLVGPASVPVKPVSSGDGKDKPPVEDGEKTARGDHIGGYRRDPGENTPSELDQGGEIEGSERSQTIKKHTDEDNSSFHRLLLKRCFLNVENALRVLLPSVAG